MPVVCAVYALSGQLWPVVQRISLHRRSGRDLLIQGKERLATASVNSHNAPDQGHRYRLQMLAGRQAHGYRRVSVCFS